MTIYDHWKNGDYNIAIASKIVKGSVLPYCLMYSAFREYRKQGMSYRASVNLVADENNTSPSLVRKALKIVRQKVS